MSNLKRERTYFPSVSILNSFGSQLYHYTSIDTLALIFKNKTIRFNRLDRVNDPQEALSKEYRKLQKIVFVSCWTDNKVESIPLWKIYAGLNGVRISMPILMFQGRNDNHKSTNDDRLYRFHLEVPHCEIKGHQGNSGYYCEVGLIGGPTRIRYVKNEELYLNNIYPDEAYIKNDFRFVGTIKSEDWSFEKEVRFRTFGVAEYTTDREDMSPETLSELIIDTEFVDIPLDNSALDEMEILLGPKISDGEHLLIESLRDKYAQNAKIYLSNIKINR
jgi:hypothetical protein